MIALLKPNLEVEVMVITQQMQVRIIKEGEDLVIFNLNIEKYTKEE